MVCTKLLIIFKATENGVSLGGKNLFMQNIYANEIIEQNNITVGIAVLNETVFENLNTIFAPQKLAAILTQVKQHPEGAYFFTRFCQYIVFVQVNNLGWSMKISDFHNDVNIALDEYSSLKLIGWSKNDIDKIMQLFQEIEKDKDSTAELVVKDAFH